MRSSFLVFALVAIASSCLAKNPDTNPGTGGAANGGTTSNGGTTGSGGTTSNGGTTSKGGTTGNGGTTSTGGSSQTQPSGTCADVSTVSTTVSGQFGGTQISVDNNSGKSYIMQANWWGAPYGNQAESVSGIGFTMTNPNNTVTSTPSTPLGFPSILIGAYQSKKTTGSNLPKQVSALTSIPTIFSTNADQKGSSSYNATYDVWFTQSSSLVTGSNPGSGGAYLMVWLFMPTDKFPRGTKMATGSIVTGVPGGWDVWYEPSTSPTSSDKINCVSYVASAKFASLEFDLNNFIKDAVANNYGVTNSQYLSIIFAGFEVWGGGDGLQVKKFCANVLQ
jgi:Glycosyl hydrolase family 12